ncbi:hypothetical protein QN372_04590 [Undibacterium sp. RTI2.1]|uniref:abortive infection system antitoxin AbiGi family protein n=1 Tax=unclassified Undibacterium TaxID=2630295 RepID=UPI002AB47F4B|nr:MULTISPECIES: abortive infection system antitoxin AbiGi family protein [unclassified Undibacterium]MDY7538456.1 hypothetical protein [Undibacterium sp. 5I1]MEB0030017.1 hypothetical protein [Undibacterium sp. RTI2.1]MEB0114920.1 hypothetical protein [Undibacterium sp. RTI2.2]MEB0230642.1 hypothetical protein [Undibacterium sp. 10I3]MEB0255879.1 hypothetical protein [Undibacterium sp. 5I1]
MTTDPYSSVLQFLHSTRELVFLEQALTQGLLLTDHDVILRPIIDNSDLTNFFINEIYPRIERKLNSLGISFNDLSDNEKNVLMCGVGAISGKIPMLCFTEIPEGRVLSTQHFGFGGYGVVIKRYWLEQNNADRVIYVGENSPTSKALYCILMDAKIRTLHIVTGKGVLWGQTPDELKNVWSLLSYVQVRHHLDELEWRIAGSHGFIGGIRDVAKRLPILLQDIEYICVQYDKEMPSMKKLIENLALQQKATSIPTILVQPETINVAA